MLWICTENSVDNTERFSLLLSSAYTESRPFHHSTSEQAGATHGAEGDTAGTADPNWPKGYTMLYDVLLSNETGRELGRESHCLGTGWTSVSW